MVEGESIVVVAGLGLVVGVGLVVWVEARLGVGWLE